MNYINISMWYVFINFFQHCQDEIENSLDEAYKTIADQENRIKILQGHIQDLEKSQEKNKIEQEMRSKEYNLLFHGFLKLRLKKYKNIQNT